MEVIRLHNIHFKYEMDWVLEGINLNIQEKEFLGIVGPNGGGKTTLLKIILGILQPQIGETYVKGTMSYVPQHLNFDKNFPTNVREVVSMGLNNKDKINQILKKMDIHDIASKKFGLLSGGQRQRTLIARALVSDPDILILDEPTANIDKQAQENVQNILKDLNKEKTIIMVSHHFDFISTDVNRVVCIDKKSHLHPTKKIEGKPIAIIDHSTDEEHSK